MALHTWRTRDAIRVVETFRGTRTFLSILNYHDAKTILFVRSLKIQFCFILNCFLDKCGFQKFFSDHFKTLTAERFCERRNHSQIIRPRCTLSTTQIRSSLSLSWRIIFGKAICLEILQLTGDANWHPASFQCFLYDPWGSFKFRNFLSFPFLQTSSTPDGSVFSAELVLSQRCLFDRFFVAGSNTGNFSFFFFCARSNACIV